jgi:uncharacterized membrane protein
MTRILMAGFRTEEEADRALLEMERAGFEPGDISVITKSQEYIDAHKHRFTRKSPTTKGVAEGAATGAVIGAIAGLLVGGPLGSFLGLVAGAAITGGVAGGLVGALMDVGIPKATADIYNEIIQSGGVILGLSGKEELLTGARDTLEMSGGRNIEVFEMRPTHTPPDSQPTMQPKRSQPAFGETISDQAKSDSQTGAPAAGDSTPTE